MRRNSGTRFCAFCKSERVVYLKKRSSLVDVACAAAASVALSVAIWQDLDPRAFVFFGVSVGVAEIFVHVRRRMSLPCPRCGFDPSLYKRDPTAAAARVKRRLAERRDDPATWLARPLPVMRPPARSRARSAAREFRP